MSVPGVVFCIGISGMAVYVGFSMAFGGGGGFRYPPRRFEVD